MTNTMNSDELFFFSTRTPLKRGIYILNIYSIQKVWIAWFNLRVRVSIVTKFRLITWRSEVQILPPQRPHTQEQIVGSWVNPAPATKYSTKSTVSSLASLRVCGAFLRIYGCILVNMRKSFANAGNLIGLGRARTLAPFFVHLKRWLF